jgi:hypothetical protein
VLDKLSEVGGDEEWFAKTLMGIIQKGPNRDQLRAMELIAKLLMHNEGQMVHVNATTEARTRDLRTRKAVVLEQIKAATGMGEDALNGSQTPRLGSGTG